MEGGEESKAGVPHTAGGVGEEENKAGVPHTAGDSNGIAFRDS